MKVLSKQVTIKVISKLVRATTTRFEDTRAIGLPNSVLYRCEVTVMGIGGCLLLHYNTY